ncbi:MAG: hypothetical protein II304_12210 [Bacteroidales bacterium]|nr:hypothetical protein [Bacteroidales bacterium]
MSRQIENQCIDCGLHCIGNACRYRNVVVDYCDDCGDEGARYRIDSDDLCEDCVKARIKEAFDDLTLSEQAEAVDIDLSEIND